MRKIFWSLTGENSSNSPHFAVRQIASRFSYSHGDQAELNHTKNKNKNKYFLSNIFKSQVSPARFAPITVVQPNRTRSTRTCRMPTPASHRIYINHVVCDGNAHSRHHRRRDNRGGVTSRDSAAPILRLQKVARDDEEEEEEVEEDVGV